MKIKHAVAVFACFLLFWLMVLVGSGFGAVWEWTPTRPHHRSIILIDLRGDEKRPAVVPADHTHQLYSGESMMKERILAKRCTVKPGDKFGRLTVLGEPFYLSETNGQKSSRAVCECECGNVGVYRVTSMKGGDSTSCKCFMRETSSQTHTRHGLHDTRLYRKRASIIQRCYAVGTKDYDRYGGRGIRVCQEWLDDPAAFCQWCEENGGNQPGLQIDRIENDGDYEPSNCQFITSKENSRKRRTSKYLTAFGETKCMSAWAEDERCKVAGGTLKMRIRTGWDHQVAISTPSGEKRCGTNS